MEQLTQVLWAAAAAVVSALAGVAIPLVRAYLTNLVQQRLGEGAARVAGEIAAKVAASPDLTIASEAMIRAGVAAIQKRFPDTAGKIPVSTITGMVIGEVGKLGVGVSASAASMPVRPTSTGPVDNR